MNNDAPLAAFLDTPETEERLAIALFDFAIGRPEYLQWDRVHEGVRDAYRRGAKHALDTIRIPHHGKING